jgi:hypothetical protein
MRDASESAVVLQPMPDLVQLSSAACSAEALVCTEEEPSTKSWTCGTADPSTNSVSPVTFSHCAPSQVADVRGAISRVRCERRPQAISPVKANSTSGTVAAVWSTVR